MKRSLRYLAGAVAVGLLLTGCSAGGDTKEEPPGPKKLVDFLWTGPALPDSTDPVIDGQLAAILGVELGSTPVTYDFAKLKNNGCTELASIGDVVGQLASSWEYSADKKTFTITFRKGVKSSFGNELTAADVKWSYDRGRALSTSVVSMTKATSHWLEGADALTVVDKNTLAVSLTEPGALDIAVFLHPRFTIEDSTEAKKHTTADDPWAKEWLGKNSANFGPWMWTEADFNPGQELIMTRNPNYFAPENYGNIGRVVMRVIPEGSTRAQLVNSGEVDYAGQLAPTDYELVRKSGKAKVLDCLAADRDTIVLQQADARFGDVRVRQAISMAIDRKELVQAAYQGHGANPSTDGLSSVYKFDRPSDSHRIKFDKAAAKKLLAEAGYPNGFSFELAYSPTRPGPQAEQIAVTAASMLKDIGLDVKIKVVASPAEFQSMFLKGQFDAVVYQEPPAIADPAYAAGLYNMSTSFQNHFNYKDANYDSLQTKLSVTEPGDKRKKLMTELASYIADTVPSLYLLDTNLPRAFGAKVDTKSYHHFPYATTLLMYRLVKE